MFTVCRNEGSNGRLASMKFVGEEDVSEEAISEEEG